MTGRFGLEDLQLRMLKLGDVDFIEATYQNPDVMQYICPILSTEKARETHFKMLQEINNKQAIYQLVENPLTKRQIGLVAMQRNSSNKSVESGIIIWPEYQNQGVFKWAHAMLLLKLPQHFEAKVCTAYINRLNLPALKSYLSLGYIKVENNSVKKRHINLIKLMYLME